ncbi:MAG: methionyl-tRNA formyltransferase [Phycisphaerales bacterium]|nr:methionyl-tRNA formyltransferase [Phycisphaerales bacterium]
MRIAFLGTGDFGAPALRALSKVPDLQIATVISQPDRPSGRGQAIHATPIHVVADELGLRHVQTDDVNNAAPADVFDGVDLAIVVAFGQKIGPALLNAIPGGFINIHASLLPKYRGAAPFQWAVINGDLETGVTIFKLNERWDAGPIWGQARVAIGATETACELHDRLSQVGAPLLIDVLSRYRAGAVHELPQDTSVASKAPKLKKSDGYVDFSQDAFAVARRINGMWDWPGVSATFTPREGKPVVVQLARAESLDGAGDAAPGVLNDDLTIACGRGRVRVLEVKPAGKRLMAFDEFARGRRLAAGDAFVSPSE